MTLNRAPGKCLTYNKCLVNNVVNNGCIKTSAGPLNQLVTFWLKFAIKEGSPSFPVLLPAKGSRTGSQSRSQILAGARWVLISQDHCAEFPNWMCKLCYSSWNIIQVYFGLTVTTFQLELGGEIDQPGILLFYLKVWIIRQIAFSIQVLYSVCTLCLLPWQLSQEKNLWEIVQGLERHQRLISQWFKQSDFRNIT